MTYNTVADIACQQYLQSFQYVMSPKNQGTSLFRGTQYQ